MSFDDPSVSVDGSPQGLICVNMMALDLQIELQNESDY